MAEEKAGEIATFRTRDIRRKRDAIFYSPFSPFPDSHFFLFFPSPLFHFLSLSLFTYFLRGGAKVRGPLK